VKEYQRRLSQDLLYCYQLLGRSRHSPGPWLKGFR
jgi:hypothetical protein